MSRLEVVWQDHETGVALASLVAKASCCTSGIVEADPAPADAPRSGVDPIWWTYEERKTGIHAKEAIGEAARRNDRPFIEATRGSGTSPKRAGLRSLLEERLRLG